MANWIFRVTKELNNNEIEVFKKIIKEIMYKSCIDILDNFIIIKIFDFNNNLENNFFENYKSNLANKLFENYKSNLANKLFENYKNNDIFKTFNETQLEKLIFLIKVFVIIITSDLFNIFKNSNLKLVYYENTTNENNYKISINYIKNELIKQLY